MTDEPPNIVLIKLDEIRREQEATNAKIGSIATGMVSMLKRLDDLDAGQIQLLRRIDELNTTVRIVAVAVDDHSHRLDRMEKRPDPTHA
jgi:hypothetical protein